MSCQLSESSKNLSTQSHGPPECSRAATTKTMDTPPWFEGTRTRQAPLFEGDGVAAMDHSKSLPLASTGVGSQTQSSPSFDLIIIAESSMADFRARVNAFRLASSLLA